MLELQKIRTTEIRIKEAFYLEILKGPENPVRISKSPNHTTSNETHLSAIPAYKVRSCELKQVD